MIDKPHSKVIPRTARKGHACDGCHLAGLTGHVVMRGHRYLGAAAGQQTYPPLTRCTCGCLSSLHKPHDVTGVRGACSNSNCPCRKFREEESHG